MIRKIRSKLSAHRGESMGETLVALLISALALLVLAGAISTAARLITNNYNSMKTYYSTGQSDVSTQWDTKANELT